MLLEKLVESFFDVVYPRIGENLRVENLNKTHNHKFNINLWEN